MRPVFTRYTMYDRTFLCIIGYMFTMQDGRLNVSDVSCCDSILERNVGV